METSPKSVYRDSLSGALSETESDVTNESINNALWELKGSIEDGNGNALHGSEIDDDKQNEILALLDKTRKAFEGEFVEEYRLKKSR